jgi:hypothetical protein
MASASSGIERAIQYFFAVKAYLVERKSPYQAIVAFSGGISGPQRGRRPLAGNGDRVGCPGAEVF